MANTSIIPIPTSTTEPGVAVRIYTNAGAPVDGTTLAGLIGKGMLMTDTTNANLYINTGTQASPVFKLIAHA